MKPVERILNTGGGLFEERGGRVLVKGTDVDLAEVWERTTEAAQEFSVSALHWALHSRGISLNLAGVLVDFIPQYPVTVEDYYLHTEAEDDAAAAVTPGWDVTTVTGIAETTAYRASDADLTNYTKPHWSLDQSLQEARDHINLLHKEVADLKQHIANLQAISLTLIGQMWTIRGVGHITDGPLRLLLDPSPELVKILSWTMAEVAAFQESA